MCQVGHRKVPDQTSAEQQKEEWLAKIIRDGCLLQVGFRLLPSLLLLVMLDPNWCRGPANKVGSLKACKTKLAVIDLGLCV